ncbi:MAG: dihydropteroate synthase, partial [Woeseia sp.]
SLLAFFCGRKMQLTLGNFSMDLSRPRVMGVLNVTSDSFSDGGEFLSRDAALKQAATMIAEGADILDVGGESTRPGAGEVSLAEEIDRVAPIIEILARENAVPVSVDTSKPEVMRAAVGAGASMINDVFALQRDGALQAASELPAAICLMHMRGTPKTMQQEPCYESVLDEVSAFLGRRVAACEAAGIERQRLVIDPGFGFGKTDAHNLLLLRRIDTLVEMGLPVLVGLSRKRTLGNLTQRAPKQRVAAGVAAAVLAVERGAHIVRTHDVAATRDALAVLVASAEVLTNYLQSESGE